MCIFISLSRLVTVIKYVHVLVESYQHLALYSYLDSGSYLMLIPDVYYALFFIPFTSLIQQQLPSSHPTGNEQLRSLLPQCLSIMNIC